MDRTEILFNTIDDKMSASSYLLADKLDDSFFVGSTTLKHKRKVVTRFITKLKDHNRLKEINGRWYKIE